MGDLVRVDVLAVSGGGGSSSQWKTPLPYLFGGLAAMFFLISMSLLFLVCSYVRRTNRLERDVEAAERSRGGRERSERGGGGGGGVVVNNKLAEKKFAVIMAGDEKPTCLATPTCYRVFDSAVAVDVVVVPDERNEGVVAMDKISSSTSTAAD